MHIVSAVDPLGLASRHGIEVGDLIEAINGEKLIDEIDYQALTAQKRVSLMVKKSDGKLKEIDIVKSIHTGLGIEFQSSLIGDPRSCNNNCIFCFIDQMAPNMRKSLYVKDDDWRMSLMMGNYVTLTNVSDQEFNRILNRKASPLYISVHATDPEIRTLMMKNKHASKLMQRLSLLAQNGLQFHCQIVLCPGINDGEVLEKTLTSLLSLSPSALSAALVPVGLTKFRSGLTNLLPYTKQQAIDVLNTCGQFQSIAMEKAGHRFVYPADELICLAEAALPQEEEYDGYPQIENGVGMIRLFEEQLKSSARDTQNSLPDWPTIKVILPCGSSIFPYLQYWIKNYIPNSDHIKVKPIINTFFGETITVTGLIVGQDLIQQLKSDKADLVILTDNMLNHENTYFLDDMPLTELSRVLNTAVVVIKTSGHALFDALKNADRLQKESHVVNL